MNESLTIVESPSTVGGSSLSLRDRIQDLMQPPVIVRAERGEEDWRIDEDCDADAVDLEEAGVHFEVR